MACTPLRGLPFLGPSQPCGPLHAFCEQVLFRVVSVLFLRELQPDMFFSWGFQGASLPSSFSSAPRPAFPCFRV